MATQWDIFFQTIIDGALTTISIGGIKQRWTGSGTPWVSETQTPFELAINDRTGQPWTPRAAPPTLLLSGSDTPSVVDRSVGGPVTETLPIQIWASTYPDAVYLKTYLQRFLTNQQVEAPVTLWIRPMGVTDYVVFEVLDGYVQELPSFMGGEMDRGLLRTNVTITRAAWGAADVGAAAISGAQTAGNSPLATPDNLTPLTTPSGEAVTTGQPMNITIAPLSTATVSRLWLATIADRRKPTSSDTTTRSTTSASGTFPVSGTIDATPALSYPVKPRAMVRVASATSNVEVQLQISTGTSGGTRVYTSPWIAPVVATTLIDFGTWPMTLFRRARTASPDVFYFLGLRSTNGASASVQFNWLELLWYYDFCRVDTTLTGTTTHLHSDQYTDSNTFMPLLVPPTATRYDSVSQTPTSFADVRGTLPRMRRTPATGGLWCSWIDSSSAHSTSAQVTLDATHLPLYATLRGGL